MQLPRELEYHILGYCQTKPGRVYTAWICRQVCTEWRAVFHVKHRKVLMSAVKHGAIHVLKFMNIDHTKIHPDWCETAMLYDQYDMLYYLIQIGAKINETVFANILRCGNIHIIEHMYNARSVDRYSDSITGSTCNRQVLQWLLDRDYKFTQKTIIYVLQRGSVSDMKFVLAHCDINVNSADVLLYGTHNPNLRELFQWAANREIDRFFGRAEN